MSKRAPKPLQQHRLGYAPTSVDPAQGGLIKRLTYEPKVPLYIPQEPKVLIAMPTMNRRLILERTLWAMLQHTTRALVELYVVVNGNDDNTASMAESMLRGKRGCHLIVNPENIGYGQAISQAYAFRQPKQHTIHMDDDTLLLGGGAVEALTHIVEGAPEVGMVNPHGFNTGAWHGLERQVGPYLFGDTGYVWTTFAMIASRVHPKLGAIYQPGKYGFEDYITSKRVQRLGYKVGYWIAPKPIFQHLGTDDPPEYVKFKKREREQTVRDETARAKGLDPDKAERFRELTDVWEIGKGPGGDLFKPLPAVADVPLVF